MMPGYSEPFHSANRKRRVLIVDDEWINRELLKKVLEEDYEVLTASDGQTAMRLIRERNSTLSLILLDLMMPGMHGLDVLRALREDSDLRKIPVIVLTSDRQAEVESLKLGAVDFIPKPYPVQAVILARVTRTIELSEDRDIIRSTERDGITGLYNRDYFFRYAQQVDQFHPDQPMDAVLVDVQRFHRINERYGKACGDRLLRRIGEKLREKVRDSEGIVCRRASDTFLIYCPHREDYRDILDNASVSVSEDQEPGGRVRLRMGVYACVDKTIELERRFDRAKMAADTLRSSYMNGIALYDQAMHESEIYAERLLEGFQEALTRRQFQVYFQPKFDIRPEIPALASAEALVRWVHPRLGLISPGQFIPLFEENGLIRQLDLYVWRETAAQIRDWKQRLGISAPVSVNVSRIDMYDPGLIDTFRGLLDEFGLVPGDLLLEITESAYTQDSTQIIDKVNRLRALGFHIEMDDFGTGYSSLNMISNLPIDALKLDMAFVRNAFRDGGDARLIGIIIDIAEYLSVPVIAEGVENAEQLDALKRMGCDLVQGYYLSRPVPADEFERFIEEKKRRIEEERKAGGDALAAQKDSFEDGLIQDDVERVLPGGFEKITYARIARALSKDYYGIFLVNTETDEFVGYPVNKAFEELHVQRSGEDFFNYIRRSLMRLVYSEDLKKALAVWNKDFLLPQLEDGRTFSTTCRMMLDGEPVYINCKVIRIRDDADGKFIVIGISDVDEQMKRERELTLIREKANRDALTGVKSKLAFTDAVAEMNANIERGAAGPFGVAFCDVNGLKAANDTMGHLAGDQLIREASHIICETFRHSPVYRVGGDEFVAILRGHDYEHREALVEEMHRRSFRSREERGIIIACGASEWHEGEDDCFESVFHRADAAMYENKAALKAEL